MDAAVAKTVETYGRLNAVINNAGGGAREMFPDETDEAWDRVIGVNLTGTFYMSRAAWGHLASADGGVIINISSGAAVMGFNDALLDSTGRAWASASYFAAKAGLGGFTGYAAGIGTKSNIRVNCVRPGQILTPLTLQNGQHRLKGAFDRVQILDGPGFPEDVANSNLFLASDEARFVTGEIINVDGGLAAKL